MKYDKIVGLKKQQEKEAQKAARAELREAARLQKEIEAQRKKIEKEQKLEVTVSSLPSLLSALRT